jgi:hypothetical protein
MTGIIVNTGFTGAWGRRIVVVMTRIRQHRSTLCALAFVVLAGVSLFVAPDALAQVGQDSKTPPTPSSSGNSPVLLQYAVLAVLVIGIVGLGILKSKREVRN